MRSYSEPGPASVATHLVHLGLAYHPTGNFDDFVHSFITVFRILTFDNWDNVWWDAMRSTGTYAAAYFIIVICIGLYLLINLTLAILIVRASGAPAHFIRTLELRRLCDAPLGCLCSPQGSFQRESQLLDLKYRRAREPAASPLTPPARCVVAGILC